MTSVLPVVSVHYRAFYH